MFDTMYEEEGIGLAANQVGVDLNLFIIDISHTDDNEYPRIFINGEITSSKGESIFSLSDVFYSIHISFLVLLLYAFSFIVHFLSFC